MTAQMAETGGSFLPVTEGFDRSGELILVCDHASNLFPPPWGDLGLSEAQRSDHIAWDPGALGLMRQLGALLDATTVHGTVSRLIYDCNRAPDMAGAIATISETTQVPGNVSVSAAERLARTNAIYLPYQRTLQALIAQRIALGRRPAVIAIHSFTPVWFGHPRGVELGVIHDRDDGLARAILAEAQSRTRLKSALNAPYSAEDDVTHTLKLQATPYGLPNAMLEIRNDLIATPEAEAEMARLLAPVLRAALGRIAAAPALATEA